MEDDFDYCKTNLEDWKVFFDDWKGILDDLKEILDDWRVINDDWRYIVHGFFFTVNCLRRNILEPIYIYIHTHMV